MKSKTLAPALVVLVCLVQPGLPVRAIEHYFYKDLGPINNTGEIAKAINRNGLVLIGDKNGGGDLVFDGANRWRLHDIIGADKGFLAYDMNDDGVIVGSMLANGGTEIHAAALIKSGPSERFGTNLVDLALGSTNSVAVSVNNAGNYVGWRIDADVRTTFRAGIGGAVIALPPDFTPARIDREGDIAGSVRKIVNGNPVDHAAMVSSGGLLVDFGILTGLDPARNSYALAINRVPGLPGGVAGAGGGVFAGIRTAAVGTSGTGDRFDHAFSWDVGSWTDLDTQPHPEREGSTIARGINRYGEIVGIVDPLFQNACIFRDGIVINLNFSFPKGLFIHGAFGWTLQTADAINEFGQIAGWSNRQAIEVDAFVLTPLRLFIDKGDGSVRLSWVTALENFSLESTSDPADPNSWQPVPATPVVEGPLNVVTLTVGGPSQFFRLTDGTIQTAPASGRR